MLLVGRVPCRTPNAGGLLVSSQSDIEMVSELLRVPTTPATGPPARARSVASGASVARFTVATSPWPAPRLPGCRAATSPFVPNVSSIKSFRFRRLPQILGYLPTIVARNIFNFVGFVYPAFRTFQALKTAEKEDDRQW